MKKATDMTASARHCIIILIFAVFSAFPALAASPRDAVAIVRPKLIPEAGRFYENLAKTFRDPGQMPLEGFEDLARGTAWGSGFLVKDRDGGVLFVTTKRAVAFADSVSLEFANASGGNRVLKDCPVAYRDTDADFAIVSLPDPTAFAHEALALADDDPAGGTDVWSAGYGGASGDAPEWTISKGIVENRAVALDAFAFPDASLAVAHSARFDTGNSGGPLLSGEPANPRSIRVVGINALGASGPDAGNAALSLKAIAAAIARYRASGRSSLAPEKQVGARVDEFLRGIGRREKSPELAYRYVSYRLTAARGYEILRKVRQIAEPERREEIDGRFSLGNAVEPVREVIYQTLYDMLHDRSPAVLVGVKAAPDGKSGLYIATIAVGTNRLTLDWALEGGQYMIVGGESLGERPIGSPEKSEKIPRAPARQLGRSTRGLLFAAGVTPLPKKDGWEYSWNGSFGYLAGINSWLTVGGQLCHSAGTATIVDNFQDTVDLFEIGLIANFQPVTPDGIFASRGLFPYATVQPNLGFMRYKSGINATEVGTAVSTGIGIQYCKTDKFSIGLEALARIQLLDEASPRLNAFPARIFLTF